jgi:hypothetical protein
MAVPVFDWDSVNVDLKWVLYFVIFLPLTLIVLSIYAIWISRGHWLRWQKKAAVDHIASAILP